MHKFKKLSNLKIFIYGFIWIIFLYSTALAEDIDTDIKLIDIDIIDAPYHEYVTGEEFILNVDPEDLHLILIEKKVRARIFRGSQDELKSPARGIKTKDNCRLFFSGCYRVKESNGGLLIDVPFTNAWLKFSNTKDLSVKAQNYVLIFEYSNSNPNYIKLKPESIDRYFSKGYPFIVRASSSINESIIREQIEIYNERYDKVKNQIDLIEANTKESPECRVLLYIVDQSKSKVFATLAPMKCFNQ